MLSVSSSSTTMSGTNSVAPLTGNGKGEKKLRDQNKKSLFGASAMEDLKVEYEVATAPTTTRPTGLPNMGMGGQVQMGVVNTMVPGPVTGSQQNMALGMQSVVPMNMQMPMQNQRLPAGVIDFRKVTSAAKNALSGALYLTTGLSTQDLVNVRSRVQIAFSGVPLNEIGINARQLEAVLAGQPEANYQGVINALMIQQQREQIITLQTGRARSNVNYQDLINQVRKMQDIANNKTQQAMMMNAGMQGMQMGTNGMQYGMAGAQGQGAIAQQSAMLQQQISMEQQKLAQMQMSTGQVPAQMQVSMGQVPAQMQVSMGQVPVHMQVPMGQVPMQMQVPMGQVPTQMPMSTVQVPMMMNQQQMGLQMQTTGVPNPAMQARTRVRPGAGRKGQVAPAGPITQGKKKKKVKEEKPLPVAPGKKRMAGEGRTPTAAPLNKGTEKRTGYANVGTAARTGGVQQQRTQQRAGTVARGRGGQRGGQRGGTQRQPGGAARGQLGQVVAQGEVYLATVQQEDDDDNGDGEDDEDCDDEDEDGDEEDVDVEIGVTVYEEDEDEDEDEGDGEEDLDVQIDVTVYEDGGDNDDEEEVDVVDVTVYEDGEIVEEDIFVVEEHGDHADVTVYETYEVSDPSGQYQVYEVDQFTVQDDQGGDSGGFDLSASVGDLNINVGGLFD